MKIFVIGASKYIGRHFQTIQKFFGDILVYIDSYEPNYIISQKPDLVIVPDEHWCELGNIVSLCKEHGILTLQLMDGILEWRRTWDYSINKRRIDGVINPLNQPAFADKIACLGYRDFKILESWGNLGKCELVGMPRLKYIQYLRDDFSHLEKKKGRILICTAKTPAFTDSQEKIVLESLQDLRDFFNIKKDIEIIWRITGNYTEKLGISNTLKDLSGQEIQQIIQQVDAVITTPSTTLIESMILKTPVALLDYHNTPHYFEAAWSISAKGHIEKVVEELLNPPVTKLEFQDFLLNEQLYLEKDATERLIELINEMLKYTNKINELPYSLLSNKYSQTIVLKSEISTYYPDLAWVDKLDIKKLKLELSAARGTIEILEKNKISLQKKLDSIPFYKLIKNLKNKYR